MMHSISILRAGESFLSVEIGEDTVLKQELMGMDKVEAEFVLGESVPILIDDYIVVNGKNYTVREAPEIEKLNANTLVYSVTFYGESYLLYDKILMDEGRSRFSYTGTPNDLLQLILTNMQVLDSGWALGNVSTIGEALTFSFNEQSCRTALDQVAEAFDLEYYISNKNIYLINSIGTSLGQQFEYGRGKGLYKLTRRSVDEAFATRWYGFGGAQNVAVTYRNALGRLSFDDNPIDVNTHFYGVKEGSVTFEEIYPRFTGTVDNSLVNNELTDADIDFDLNDLIITEGAAKIVFKSGDLSGNEFPITAYDHVAKKVTFGITEDENGYILPNDTVNPSTGDEFTFVGIEMPQSYIDAAESELKVKVEEHASNNSSPKVAYDLEIDEKYIRVKNLTNAVLPGDSLTVIDDDLSVNDEIRIQSVEYPLVKPSAITAIISDVRQYTERERIVKDLRGNQRELDKRIAQSIYGRQVADEIRNYAVMEQFDKTKVGDRAVMSGAFVAGNPSDGEVAGINGTGSGDDIIRFWAGESFDNKESAPFRVTNRGVIYFFKANSEDGASVLIDDVGLGSNGIEYDGTTIVGGVNTYEGENRGGGNPLADIKSSVFGGIENGADVVGIGEIYPDNSGNNYEGARAGIIGMIVSQWVKNDGIGFEVADLLVDQLKYCKGFYGALLSSLKNTGSEYQAMRKTNDNDISERDRNFIISGGGATKYLPERPDHGYVISIKNETGVSKTIERTGATDLIRLKGGTANIANFSLAAREIITLKFFGSERKYYEI